jgi:DNA primase
MTDEERLTEIVPMLITAFKNAIVEQELNNILKELKNPDISNDPKRYMALMQRYQELGKLQSAMAKDLGDRVVLHE